MNAALYEEIVYSNAAFNILCFLKQAQALKQMLNIAPMYSLIIAHHLSRLSRDFALQFRGMFQVYQEAIHSSSLFQSVCSQPYERVNHLKKQRY